MPDHVHLIVWFPEIEKRVQAIVSKWKEWTAKTLNIEWQRDFFEHRLRREESLREKADYILANPVRAALVKKPEAWPYVFHRGTLVGTARCAASLPSISQDGVTNYLVPSNSSASAAAL